MSLPRQPKKQRIFSLEVSNHTNAVERLIAVTFVSKVEWLLIGGGRFSDAHLLYRITFWSLATGRYQEVAVTKGFTANKNLNSVANQI